MRIIKKNLKPYQIRLIKSLLEVYQFYYSFHITPLSYECIYFGNFRYVILKTHFSDVLNIINSVIGDDK